MVLRKLKARIHAPRAVMKALDLVVPFASYIIYMTAHLKH